MKWTQSNRQPKYFCNCLWVSSYNKEESFQSLRIICMTTVHLGYPCVCVCVWWCLCVCLCVFLCVVFFVCVSVCCMFVFQNYFNKWTCFNKFKDEPQKTQIFIYKSKYSSMIMPSMNRSWFYLMSIFNRYIRTSNIVFIYYYTTYFNLITLLIWK